MPENRDYLPRPTKERGMIAIVNISDVFSEKGLQKYSLRINNKEICRFLHKREEGLAKCLLTASKTVEVWGKESEHE